MKTRRGRTVEERVINALKNRGFVSKRQLRAARAKERVNGTSVLDTLVSSGVVKPETLETVVMFEAKIRTVDLGVVEIDTQALRVVSREYAEQKCILPVGFAEDGSLKIAAQNFVPAKIVPELMRTIPLKLTFFLGIGGNMQEAIGVAYSAS